MQNTLFSYFLLSFHTVPWEKKLFDWFCLAEFSDGMHVSVWCSSVCPNYWTHIVMRVNILFFFFIFYFALSALSISNYWFIVLVMVGSVIFCFFAYILFLFLLYCWFGSGCISTCMDSLHYATHPVLRWLFAIQLVCAQHHWNDVNGTSTVQFIGQECIDWCKRHPANREQLNTTWSWSSSAGSISARNIGSSIWCVVGLCRSRWICK